MHVSIDFSCYLFDEQYLCILLIPNDLISSIFFISYFRRTDTRWCLLSIQLLLLLILYNLLLFLQHVSFWLNNRILVLFFTGYLLFRYYLLSTIHISLLFPNYCFLVISFNLLDLYFHCVTLLRTTTLKTLLRWELFIRWIYLISIFIR